MKKPYLAELLKRYLHHDCTTGEAWTVEQWYEARDMPRPAVLDPAELAAAKARTWQQVRARTRPRPAPRRWAAAAALALGAGLALVGPYRHWTAPSAQPTAAVAVREARGWRTCTNPTAAPVAVALADGSTATLQPGSSLRYPGQFGGPERVVTLRGEAFFQVFHDARHPFRVLTDKLETTVLGTSFTVRAYPGQAEATVRVRTGRVSVRPTNAPAGARGPAAQPAGLVLRPNQQTVYAPGAPVLRAQLVDQPVLLCPQAFVFTERPVAEVLASLAAGYGVPIRYDGAALAPCTVSLAFGPDDSLFARLDLLCRVLDAAYERTGDAIVFRSRGCQSD